MESLSTNIRILESFIHEGVRAFFRPKLKEPLYIPRMDIKYLGESERMQLSRNSLLYFYTGLVIELITATTIFISLMGVAYVVQILMERIVESYGNIKKWDSVIELFSNTISGFSLILFVVFTFKLLFVVLQRSESSQNTDA